MLRKYQLAFKKLMYSQALCSITAELLQTACWHHCAQLTLCSLPRTVLARTG